MWEYSDTVKEHYKNPKNVGMIEDADAIGEAGALACGDALKLYLKIKDGIVTDAKFQTFGCGSAVASSSILTEMIIGKPLDEVKKITNKDIADKLGGLPPEKMHCSVMGHEALEDALKNYDNPETQNTDSTASKPKSKDKIICNCFSVTEKQIKEAIEKNGAKTVDDIKELTYAGGACGRCKGNIQAIINTYNMEAKNDKKELNAVQFILKVNSVIEKNIAPELTKDCGGIELINIEGKDVYVRLTGSCKGCRNSHLTLKNFVQTQLREHVDNEINVIEVE